MSTSNEIFDLLESPEIDNNYDELQSLIDADRSVLQSTGILDYTFGNLPIHFACSNPHITLRVVQLLLDKWPGSISQANEYGSLPIHFLCENDKLVKAVLVDILTVLLTTFPESVQHENSDGALPLHRAARSGMPLEVLKILVNMYPESVRIPVSSTGALPIHRACVSSNCNLDSVEYLLLDYPEGINVRDSEGRLPIHYAAISLGAQKADVIEHLLSKDLTCVSKVTNNHRQTPLHLACLSDLAPDLSSIQLLFDAYPEAILERDVDGYTPLRFMHMIESNSITDFLQTQLEYAKKSQDINAMAALDQNRWLPLHHALKNNAPLGSIKLLVKGFALAVRVPDNNMTFPLHIAFEYSTIKVVRYLMSMLDDSIWNHLDVNKDSILHYACRGGNCEVVKYLLDKQSPYVSEHNADKKLPIHLLCQYGLPPSSLEHTDTVYRLLLADPETVRKSGDSENGGGRDQQMMVLIAILFAVIAALLADKLNIVLL